jgi:hypothetical protein
MLKPSAFFAMVRQLQTPPSAQSLSRAQASFRHVQMCLPCMQTAPAPHVVHVEQSDAGGSGAQSSADTRCLAGFRPTSGAPELAASGAETQPQAATSTSA